MPEKSFCSAASPPAFGSFELSSSSSSASTTASQFLRAGFDAEGADGVAPLYPELEAGVEEDAAGILESLEGCAEPEDSRVGH